MLPAPTKRYIMRIASDIMPGIELIRITSKTLSRNPLNDPAERDLVIFKPDEIKEGAPLLIGLSGFGGGARNFLNFSPLSTNFTDVVSDLRREGKLKDAVIAVPDCFTSYGGNQYVNSRAMGDYEDFIIRELIPEMKQKFKTGKTGVFGKSSGGFGSYTLAVHNPDAISGFADHSGDAGFEYCYLPDFPATIREFRKAGGPKEWFNLFQKSKNKSAKRFMEPLNILAMAASYTPNTDSETMGIDFPFDMNTGELLDDVWEKWKKFDPARTISWNIQKMREMDAVYLDVGSEDEFNINIGMRKMHRILEENKVEHFFEEFEDGHFNITYRYEKSLAYLAERLSK